MSLAALVRSIPEYTPRRFEGPEVAAFEARGEALATTAALMAKVGVRWGWLCRLSCCWGDAYVGTFPSLHPHTHTHTPSPSSAVPKAASLIWKDLRFLSPGFLHYIFHCIFDHPALFG